MLHRVPPRRKTGGFASRIKSIGGFVASTRFFSGFAVAILLATGYQSMSAKEPVRCPIPLATAAAPDPEPEGPLYAGETSLVASEFAEVQYGPPRRSAPPKKQLVRFDTHGKCLQVKDQNGVFVPDGCIVHGDTVQDKKQFDQQHARVGRDEVRWKAEESAAGYR